jgi:FAD/FMN-containing dehydrogenase
VPRDEFIERVSEAGITPVLPDDAPIGYKTDWTGRWRGEPRAVLRPRDTREVADVLKIAYETLTPIVTRGGGTGLVGAGVPSEAGDEVVLSCEMIKGVSINPHSRTAEVGAGVTLSELNEAAYEHNLMFAVDIGSRDSATIGGMISTNAGGLRMMKWGDTRSQVLGLEVVTGRGETLRDMRPLVKNNLTLRWTQLVCGSEGTMGVVCRAVVKLVERPRERLYAWIPVLDAAEGVSLASQIARVGRASAVEYVHEEGVALVRELLKREPPAGGSALIVEVCGDDTEHDMGLILSKIKREDALVGEGVTGKQIWEWRDRHTEAIAARGVAVKCDTSIPLERWAEFHDSVPQMLADLSDDLYCVRFGHIADGNLHVNVLSKSGVAGVEVDDAVWRLVVSHGGSISAEHGVGVAKAKWLNLMLNETEIRNIEHMRKSWDPAGVLNPRTARDLGN